MCRLYAFRSNAPRDVRAELIEQRNSLKSLSREHPDGWGIATWDPAKGPNVVRGVSAAYADPGFDTAASPGPSSLLFAHVRLASVGNVLIENVHPFTRGPWAFMHNGTLTDFKAHRDALEAHIDSDLLETITSTTDSERCFLLFLTALRAQTAGREEATVQDAAAAIATVMRLVERHTDVPGGLASSMNFLASDGRILVASRRGRSLFISDGVTAGGMPECGRPLPQIAIASEPASDEFPWNEVAEDDILGIDAALTLQRWNLREL